MEEQRLANAQRSRTDWGLQAVLLIVSIVLILQNTKQAMLPRSQTPYLWTAEGVTIACILLLRSGWGRDTEWARGQEQLGTLANNFYEPRRAALITGAVIGCGVFGALWWALATWGVMFTGMRRGVPTRGLLDFMVGALMGACVGGLLGAVMGLAIGHTWEKRHRRRRLLRHATHA